jgi:hypothetical protein
MLIDDLKSAAKRIPGLRPLVSSVRSALLSRQPKDRIFREIYERNGWAGAESVSGQGSDDVQTRRIREELPRLWERRGVRHLVDAPCGDFRWMRTIVQHLEGYTGLDIVEPLIAGNARTHGTDRVRFAVADVIRDPLPAADMILCRDCLVHLSFDDVRAALANMRRSGTGYLLTTTFPAVTKNRNIATGDWRPLNLRLPPFDFPEPVELINEECTEFGGRYADKSLGLWRLAEL